MNQIYKQNHIKRFTLLFVFLLICAGSYAQPPQYASGGNVSNNAFPFNIASTGSNKVQWIYVPTEFAPAAPSGLITKIYVKAGSAATNVTYTNLTIKMGYTAAVNTVTGAFVTAGFTTVFSQPSTTLSSTIGGWVGFTLSTPFFYNNTQNLLLEISQQNMVGTGFTTSQSTTGGNKRLFGNFASATGTAGTGLAHFGFDLIQSLNNASVTAIPEPSAAICLGTFPVKTQIKNMGANIINNVKINWTVNGTPQPIISYNTPIPIAGTSPVITLGSVNFPASNITNNIRVWTTLPNGVADPKPEDDTMQLARQALDPPNAVIYFTKSRACPGDSIQLQAATGTGYTYMWQFNADPIPGATQSSYYAKQHGNYSVKVFNPGCNSQSNFHTMTIKPLQVDLGPDKIVCETIPAMILDAQEDNVDYLWSTGSTLKTINVTEGTNKYWVKVSLGQYCKAADTVTVQIDPLPKVNGISTSNNLNTYYFSPAGQQYATSYLWDFGDGATDIAMLASHTYSIPGPYNIKLSVYNGCGIATSNLSLPITTGTAKLITDNNIIIYPNPAQNILNISTGVTTITAVKIFNITGSIVLSENIDNNRKIAIDISSLPNGTYTISAITSSGNLNQVFQVYR